MKKAVKVLIILVLLGGLVCSLVGLAQAGLSKKKIVELRASLVDAKADINKEWYILYLDDHEAIMVPPDGVTIKYIPNRTSAEPQVTAKGREYYVEKYNKYDEAIFIFKDREEYLKYFGDIKDVKLPLDDPLDCFIATAAYGTPLHPHLDVLRSFRDNTLKKNWFGQRFVDWYYKNGPAMAEWVAKSEARKSFVRNFLIKPAVSILKTFEK